MAVLQPGPQLVSHQLATSQRLEHCQAPPGLQGRGAGDTADSIPGMGSGCAAEPHFIIPCCAPQLLHPLLLLLTA